MTNRGAITGELVSTLHAGIYDNPALLFDAAYRGLAEIPVGLGETRNELYGGYGVDQYPGALFLSDGSDDGDGRMQSQSLAVITPRAIDHIFETWATQSPAGDI